MTIIEHFTYIKVTFIFVQDFSSLYHNIMLPYYIIINQSIIQGGNPFNHNNYYQDITTSYYNFSPQHLVPHKQPRSIIGITSAYTKINLHIYSSNHKTKLSIKTHLFSLKDRDTISFKKSHLQGHRIRKQKREIMQS